MIAPTHAPEQANESASFAKHGEQACCAGALLDNCADHGIADIEDPKVLELPPLDQYGTKSQIRRGIFGGAEAYAQAVTELERALYADMTA